MPKSTSKQTVAAKPARKSPLPKPDQKPSPKKTRGNRSRRSGSAAAEQPLAPPVEAAPDQPQYWRRIDLHLHTPGSSDYEQPELGYLDILKQAEARGLDVIAFTDHNTSNGYRNMQREIADLELLERIGRIRADELGRLSEYRRLLHKILVLPGFEFTATFGFHILGIFSPSKPIREIEHVLLGLRVPSKVIDAGLTEAGATSDVLMAYKAIDEAGGIAIAAHANSSNGVSMRNLNLGGQTRIAFTQDPHLHAIEFTDLDKGRFSSGRLFTAIRPEYPRRMHLLQGSDAHRVTADPKNEKRLGVGDRVTEVWLEEVSFEALKKLFLSEEFGHVRATFAKFEPKQDLVQAAREAGAGLTRSFHAALPKRGDRYVAVLQDVCAMANSDGGDIFIGCDASPNKRATGLADAASVMRELGEAISARIAPPPAAAVELKRVNGVPIVAVGVPQSHAAPHTLEGVFYARDGAADRPASRDEIVAMARRAFEAEGAERARQAQPQPQPQQHARHERGGQERRHEQRQHEPRQQQAPRHEAKPQQPAEQTETRRQDQARGQAGQRRAEPRPQQQPRAAHDGQRGQRRGQRREEAAALVPGEPPAEMARATSAPIAQPAPVQVGVPEAGPAETPELESAVVASTPSAIPPLFDGAPRTGVQIAAVDVRDGIRYFTVRDLRKGALVRNVTIKSARDLWHYAVTKTTTNAYAVDKIEWTDNRALLGSAERGGKLRYDLAMRNGAGDVQIFFGVTEDGMDGTWRAMLPTLAPEGNGAPPEAESVADLAQPA